jgi:DNA invertase Pin-like site-specific DNA recombinase
MTKVALYVRVSTDKQELLNQINELEEYCKKSNYEIFWIYKDVISGIKDTRPGFDKLFEDAHKKKFDLVLFWDLSRFSRSGLLFTLQKLKELENLGIDWESYQEKYFKSLGAFKDVVLSLISTLAKIERDRIIERTKAGMKRAKLQGKICNRPLGSKDTRKRKRKYWKKPE